MSAVARLALSRGSSSGARAFSGVGQHACHCWKFSVLIWVALLCGPAGWAQSPLPPEDAPTRASLAAAAKRARAEAAEDDRWVHEIYFQDVRHGWAVGDHGLLLSTRDGGRTWERQSLETREDLSSIRFFDAARGVIGGGGYEPYTGNARPVALWTNDSGRTWREAVAGPEARTEALLTTPSGVVLAGGDWSSRDATSLFRSIDDGKSWAAEASSDLPPIRKLVLLDGQPVALDRDGQVWRATFDGQWQKDESLPDCIDLVAEGGLLLAALDGGKCVAIEPDGNRHELVFELGVNHRADLQHVAIANGIAWTLAGPAGPLWKSGDFGRTWQLVTMTVPTQVVDWHVLDEQHLWLVGPWGTICASRDAGQSWQWQRHGQLRAAILIVGNDPRRIPWSVLASYGGGQGCRAVVTMPRPKRDSDPMLAPLLQQTSRAIRAAGGDGVIWSSSAQESVTQQRAAEVLLHTLKPSAVVFAGDVANSTTAVWLQALATSGVAELRSAWRVVDSERADVEIHGNAVLADAGQTVDAFQAQAFAHLAPLSEPAPVTRLAQVWIPDGGQPLKQLVDQASIVPGGPARRMHVSRNRNLAVLQVWARHDHWQRTLIDEWSAPKSEADPTQSLRWLMQQLPSEQADPFLAGLLRRAAGSDRIDAWTIAVRESARRASPLGDWAKRQLDSLAASREWKHWQSGDATVQQASYRTAAPTVNLPPPTPIQRSPFDQREPELPKLTESGANEELSPTKSPTEPLAADPPQPEPAADAPVRAERYNADRLQLRTLVRDHWSIHEPPATGPALDLLERLAVSRSAGPWAMFAKHVLRIRSDEGPDGAQTGSASRLLIPELGGMESVYAIDPPRLDGELTEPLWNGLLSGDDRWRVAHDEEYLYVAWTVHVDPTQTTAQRRSTTRVRDADVENTPRAVLELDLDGDVSTNYRFELTLGGETHDRCCGHRGWQPVWFVAMQQPGDHWRVELAIRMSDLWDREDAQSLPLSDQRWNARLQLIGSGPFDPHPVSGWQPLYFAKGMSSRNRPNSTPLPAAR